MKRRTEIFILLLPFLLFSCSCKKNNSLGPNPVPYVPVSTIVDYSNPTYAALANQGGYVYIPGGNKGIIVLQDFEGNFWAFDRTCPYHVTSPCGLIYMGSLQMVCGNPTRCCDNTYALAGGTHESGKGTYPLKAYHVTQSGTQLYITN